MTGDYSKSLPITPLFVGEQSTPYIQEIHLMTYHHICEQVEARLFAKKKIGLVA